MADLMYDGVDLYAGPGGIDVAAESLDVHLLGIESDGAAVATRAAAGLATHHGSVLDVDPRGWTGCQWLAGGPPCQTFSKAGKGSGRQQLDLVLRAVKRLGAGEWPAEEIAATHDDRTTLVLQPLRWALVAQPLRIMLEQVPEVAPVWEAMAEVLAGEGYHVATGVLRAEEYGVGQTRRRAVLLAHLERPVSLPAPTHSRYVKGKPRDAFGLVPWVSMAEALGWVERADVTLRTPSMLRAYDATVPMTLAEPAPTLAMGHDAAALRWIVKERLADQTGTPVDLEWPANRPATVVAGRGLVQHPGATANRFNGSTKSRNDGIRVTVAEAAALQGFPPDYPWSGPKQFEQVGNAMPPPMARACLEALL